MAKRETVELSIGLVDEEGKKLTGAEFVKWMTKEMEVFVVECGDGKKKMPSEWLKILAEFWSN